MRRTIAIIVAIVVVGVLAVLLVTRLTPRPAANSQSASPSGTTSASGLPSGGASPAATQATGTSTQSTSPGAGIAITAPGTVPSTFSLRGTGDIPAGMYLVAFVWAPGTGKYYTDGPAEMNSPGNWWVPEVFLGDHSDQCSNGHTYRIVMVLMSAQAQAANAAYHSANYDAPYSPSTFRSITAGFPTWTAIATRAGTPPAGC